MDKELSEAFGKVFDKIDEVCERVDNKIGDVRDLVHQIDLKVTDQIARAESERKTLFKSTNGLTEKLDEHVENSEIHERRRFGFKEISLVALVVGTLASLWTPTLCDKVK